MAQRFIESVGSASDRDSSVDSYCECTRTLLILDSRVTSAILFAWAWNRYMTHDLERTIIMQQLDEAQVAQAAAETARDSMQSFVDAAAAHQDQCEQELQELRLKYHQLEEQLDDANLQLAAARGEVDFTTAQNTLMEDENTRLENDNDRLVEDRKVLASQNEVLFKSLLSHQETLEYLLKKDSPAEVLHELGRSKEELERVQRDLELSRSSVQTLQETISLHLDTISVKDEQIYVLNTLINTLENRVSTVQASSLVVSQQHTDLVLAHSATSTTLNGAVSFIRKLSHALLLQRSLDLQPFLVAICRDLATLSKHCRDADWTQTMGMFHHIVQSLQTIRDITTSAAYARARQTELIDLDGMVESAQHIIAEAHGDASIPAMDLSVHRLDPELPIALRNTPDSSWAAPDSVSFPHVSSNASTSIFGDDYSMATPETEVVSHRSSPQYQPYSPEVDIDDYDGDEDFRGDLAYPHLED
ncbi:hypothetical protein EV361DRAFT_1015683 [Lentinula raphanica]|nr:hypothetical protein EV361DRAFT_1015683 [Lentinula raphanica]